jgi:[acyl-carrier-protein] S-malonyltransferase
VTRVIVLLVPGQGSQTPGLLAPWLELPGTRALLGSFSEAAGMDLLALGTTGTAEQIRDTAVAQPLLTAAALLSSRAVDVPVGAVCGHSVGEVAALAIAGVIEPLTAVFLAAERGKAMAQASALRPTGMCAVLGGVEEEILEQATGLELAIRNAPGQLVLSGPVDALTAFSANPPKGARVRPLATAGAFHSSAMLPAVPQLQILVSSLTARNATIPVVANADGALVTDGRELLDRLVGQLTGAVRFDSCLQTIAGLGAAGVLELAPAGTLTAIAKRAGLETVELDLRVFA